MPPTALVRSVAAFTARVTPVTDEAMFTAKREPMPVKTDRNRQRKGFSVFIETERIMNPLKIRKAKIM